MADAGTALPNSVNLAAQKPFAVKSYVRRFRNIQSNNNGNTGQLAEVIIPIDTGTPGAFLDCAQSYLQYDLQIINPNPYIDYVDFDCAGANSVWEQMQIRSAGTGIETIREYGTVFNAWMKIEGEAQEAFQMYMSRLDESTSEFHINNVKRPMVDWSGRIMNAWEVGGATVPFTNNCDFTSDSRYSAAFANESSGYVPLTGVELNQDADPGLYPGSGNQFGVGPTTGLITYPVGLSQSGSTNTAQYYSGMGVKWGMLRNDLGADNINLWPYNIGRDMSERKILQKTSKRFQDYLSYLAHVQNIPIGCTSSLPSATGGAGFRGLPENTSTVQGPLFTNGNFTMTVCVPVLSGILGVMQEKMIPTMLLDNFQLVMTTTNYSKALKVSMDPCRIIPGTWRDFLTYFGTELNAMTCLPGASGGGSANNAYSLVGRNTFNQLLPAAYNWQLSAPPQWWQTGYIEVFSSVETFPPGNVTTTPMGFATFTPSPTVTAAGASFNNVTAILANRFSQQSNNQQSAYTFGPWPNTIASNPLPYPLQGCLTNASGLSNQPYGQALHYATEQISIGGGTAVTVDNYATAGGLASFFARDTPVPQYYHTVTAPGYYNLPVCNYYGVPCPGNLALSANTLTNTASQSGYPTNLTSSAITGIYNIGNDAMACFGTFLRQSQAQSARCIQNYQQSALSASNGIPYARFFPGQGQGGGGAGPNQGMPYFQISNVYFVAQQVILPDEVTAQILQAAANGDISMQTHTIQVYANITLASGSSSQNIIIPAKVGSANTLYALFKHSDQITAGNKQMLYNCLTGVCPISYASYQADGVSYYGTNTPPQIGYVQCASNNQFSFQLKIGNDLVPAQPIQSATELLNELEKCTHGLNLRDNSMSYAANIINQPIAVKTGTVKNVSQLVFDCFTDGGFWTTWCDPFFLQDQTIVNNGAWSLLVNAAAAVPGISSGTGSTTQAGIGSNFWAPVQVGQYSIPAFKTPDSSFIVGFDLDTWSAFSDVAMSGRYLGNNTVSIQCSGLDLVRIIGSQSAISCTCFIMCDARWSLQAGGNSQLFI